MHSIESLITLVPDRFRERLVSSLAGPGYAIFPELIRPELASEIRTEMVRLQKEGAFHSAGVGKGSGDRRHPEIRGDGSYWFEPSALTPTQRKLEALFDNVRESLNAEFFLGLWDWEGHYAIYPPGSFYRRHFDRFRDDSKRTVSIILFFNPDWTKEDGGALRIDSEEGVVDVFPRVGTAVFFLSGKIPHEVLETKRERFSFAGWFRTRDQRM